MRILSWMKQMNCGDKKKEKHKCYILIIMIFLKLMKNALNKMVIKKIKIKSKINNELSQL
jgi:hypothetical protein